MTAALQCGEAQWTFDDVPSPRTGDPMTGLDRACRKQQEPTGAECSVRPAMEAPDDLPTVEVDMGEILDLLIGLVGSLG